MYSSSATSSNPVVEQFNRNKQNLINVKRDVSPLAGVALSLAQTAQDMKAHVTATTGNSKTMVFASHGGSIQSKNLIKLLGDSRNALQSFASKAQSLDREVTFFSNHQDGLFQGNLAVIPQADKVNWCTGQVEKIMKRTSKLGADQGPKVATAVSNLRLAAQYTRQTIHSDLDAKVVALNRHIH